MKENNRASKLLTHQYPPILFRFPWLIHLLYLWNRLTTLRVWHVRAIIKKIMREHPQRVMDIGLGEGQYLWWMKRTWSKPHYWGIDQHYPHILFAHHYRTHFSKQQIILSQANIEWISIEEIADLAICVGVLQYVKDDEHALKRMYRLLKPGGKVLIYVPVTGKVIFSWYERYLTSLPNYEQLQGRKRIYQPEEILEKVLKAGFVGVEKIFTYGTMGIMAYEIYNTLFYGLLYGTLLRKILSSVLLVFILPILWGMMWVDYWKKHEEGNGILLIAKKP